MTKILGLRLDGHESKLTMYILTIIQEGKKTSEFPYLETYSFHVYSLIKSS